MKGKKQLEEWHAIPQGSYEAGRINDRSEERRKRDPEELTTDLQGNGYPLEKNKKE